jgi:signal transduction histidine kinase
VNGSRSRTAWFVAAAVVAAGLAILASVWVPTSHPDAYLSIAGAAAAFDIAVFALAAARFRDSRDPHALFLAVAFLVLALQQAIFGVWWPLAHPGAVGIFVDIGTTGVQPRRLGATFGHAPTYALQAGWVAAGVLILLALPWSERRGRPPVRPARVTGLALIAVVVADVILVAAFRHQVSTGLGPLAWILGVVATALLAVAAVREAQSPRAGAPYLSVGLLLGAVYQFGVFSHDAAGYPNAMWSDVLLVVVPALALVSLLLDQRTEVSQMRRATDRAQEVMGGRAEIASMVAHEVRGPVSTVRGIASTSLTHFERLSDEERREFLEMIEQESGRLMETVDQMSMALKVDAGTLPYQKEAVDLGEVTRAGAAAAGVVDHGIEVHVDGPIPVQADPRRLQEVVRQLVSNAARYSPSGSPIEVEARRDGATGVIEVSDEGPGIPADMRERVFEKFPNWRPDGYVDQPGTGLGLFICRGIVTEHAGEIGVVGGPGGGTMLRVRIPVEG